jgi:hypothetical protein
LLIRLGMEIELVDRGKGSLSGPRLFC